MEIGLVFLKYAFYDGILHMHETKAIILKIMTHKICSYYFKFETKKISFINNYDI